jgi:hypothetical protein
MMPAPKFPQYKTLIFETWPIERCIGYARNPRKNDHAVDSVASAIREFGFRVPIVAKSDGTVVDGHLRLKAAAKLGLTEVPVILADDLTDAQIKAFRLSVNKVSEFAEWDVELLKLEFADLDAAGFDLTLTGFDLGEIAALTLDETEGLTDPNAGRTSPARPPPLRRRASRSGRRPSAQLKQLARAKGVKLGLYRFHRGADLGVHAGDVVHHDLLLKIKDRGLQVGVLLFGHGVAPCRCVSLHPYCHLLPTVSSALSSIITCAIFNVWMECLKNPAAANSTRRPMRSASLSSFTRRSARHKT